jgi:hypothetical protein
MNGLVKQCLNPSAPKSSTIGSYSPPAKQQAINANEHADIRLMLIAETIELH